MKNFLKHSFNTVSCIAGATFSLTGMANLGIEAARLVKDIPISSLSREDLLLTALFSIGGSLLFQGAYNRFTTKPKTADKQDLKGYARAAFHATSAYLGAATLGISNTLFSMASSVRTPSGAMPPELEFAWLALNAFGVTAFALGYSRALSKKPMPAVSVPTPQAGGPA